MKTSPCRNAKSARPNADIPSLAAMRIVRTEDQEQVSSTILRAHEVLTELYALLGDYSPMWFTQKENERAERALHELKHLVSIYPGKSA